jgi:hypothetical protein
MKKALAAVVLMFAVGQAIASCPDFSTVPLRIGLERKNDLRLRRIN